MSSLCSNCGTELGQTVTSTSITWECPECGWAKYEKLATSCCGADWEVGGRGTTHYYVCLQCDQACDVLPFSKTKKGDSVDMFGYKETTNGR